MSNKPPAAPDIRPYEYIIDLMILEEMYASAAFREWFASGVTNLPTGARFLKGGHSVVWGDGESDLELEFERPDGSVFVLYVEDKINAVLQPEQVGRYRRRGETHQREGRCTDFAVMLVAPRRYLDRLPEHEKALLDAMVSLEELRTWYLTVENESERAEFKAHLLAAAIDKRPRVQGGQAASEPDPKVTDFFAAYWEVIQQRQSPLVMPRPGVRSKAQPWVYFRGAGTGVMLVHKLDRGVVEVILEGHAHRIEHLQRSISHTPAQSMWTVRRSQAVLSMDVPALDIQSDCETQHANVVTAISAAERLLEWCAQNPQLGTV